MSVKKFLILVLMVVLCLPILPINARAAERASGKLLTGQKWTLDTDGVLRVTGTGNMQAYSYADEVPWYVYRKSITSLIIEEGITSTGDYVAYGCENLTNVSLPSTLTKIGSGAFIDCKKLTELTIPESVTVLAAGIFKQCRSLRSIKIPDGVTYIPDRMFSLCSGLKSIVIPEGVTRIGTDAFEYCSELTYIVLPQSLNIVKYGAFSGCNALNHVFYSGTETQWKKITFESYNTPCTYAVRHTNASKADIAVSKQCTAIDTYCRICNEVFFHIDQDKEHIWDNGIITTKPSCKEEGVRTYTCTACSATKTDAVEKLTTHSYGAWIKETDTTHKQTCTVCQDEETANHIWNSGAITQVPTCKDEGIKTYMCADCKAVKTEDVAKLTTHTYDNDCDTVCNVCGKIRTVTHQYSDSWSKNQAEHWHTCMLCGDKADQTAHIPGAAATETTAQSCTECGYVIKAALGHTHSYEFSWSKDAAGHWHACVCGGQKDYAEHSYKNTCDTDCDACGSIRTITHTPGPAATATTDQTCTICGEILAKATGETTTTPPVTEPNTPPISQPVEPETQPSAPPTESTGPSGTDTTRPEGTPVAPTEPLDNNKASTDTTVWIVVAVAVALLGGGAVMGVFIWKKKH